MSRADRPLWAEGLLLGPHHFQQQERFLLAANEAAARRNGPYPFGFTTLEIDEAGLAEGVVRLVAAAGLFSDGTPFVLPADAPLPEPLAIAPDARGLLVSLALPRLDGDAKDFAENRAENAFARYVIDDLAVDDRHTPALDSQETLFVGRLWTRLILEGPGEAAFHTVPVARVLERRDDGTVRLDPGFSCCAAALSGTAPVHRLGADITSLLGQRAAEIAARVGRPDAADGTQVSLFLLLQSINRARALLQHLLSVGGLHPEGLYRELVQLAGELATLTTPERLGGEYAAYEHRDQLPAFQHVVAALRESLNWIPDSSAEAIPVQHIRAGIYTATVRDPERFATARFILAARGSMTPAELSRQLPRQTTIASKTRLRDLVEAQSRGVELRPLTTVPSSLPTYEDRVYFELGKDSALWPEIATGGVIALHVAGTVPDLDMQLWTLVR